MVQKRNLKQWFILTTKFAQQLYDGLDSPELKQWPNSIINAQKRWIKPSDGHLITFKTSNNRDITVFTTRIDTLPKVNFIALAQDHEFADNSSGDGNRLIANLKAKNPLTGSWIPVYVADYVVSDYGSNAVMGVPSEDERDLTFAQSLGIPILPSSSSSDTTPLSVLIENGSVQAKKCYRLRDWLVSRQRYWVNTSMHLNLFQMTFHIRELRFLLFIVKSVELFLFLKITYPLSFPLMVFR